MLSVSRPYSVDDRTINEIEVVGEIKTGREEGRNDRLCGLVVRVPGYIS
jgi:hypothetical protein